MLNGNAGTWDEQGVYDPSVILDGSTYKMWYRGSASDIGALGYATSTDGVTWVKSGSNPILVSGTAGAWDASDVSGPTVIKDGSTYKMWYAGKSDSNPDYWYRMAIGYATSSDGVTWVKSGSNPVLVAGTAGAWDDYEVSSPTVIKDGSTYKMWYTGTAEAGNMVIGYATSSDGVTWVKSGSNPVVSVGSAGEWDASYVYDPSVTYNGCQYELWYTGSRDITAIGYATSTDGVAWVKSGSNPVLTTGLEADWDYSRVDQPDVLQNGTTYYMWYEGGKLMGDPIGLATVGESSGCSSDTPAPTPTPTPPSSSSGSVSAPSCPDSVPSGPPQLLVAQPNYQGEVTLRWEKAPDPVTHYAIVYGFSPGNYNFGVVNVGNVQTFTIGNLDRHITYYFAVKAVNGCAPGPLSNVLGAGSDPSVPVSGESWVTISLGIAGLLLMGIGLRVIGNRK